MKQYILIALCAAGCTLLAAPCLALSDDELSAFTSNDNVTFEWKNSRQLVFTLSSDGLPTQDVIDQFEDGNFRGNPNEVLEQTYEYKFPATPTYLDDPHCLPQGPIAMTIDGLVFFNPYTSGGLDAVENEVMGICNGHPDGKGRYHHHSINSCVYDGSNDQLLGVAFDGYPIYGPIDDSGNTLTNDDLDECHGRWETVDGEDVYRYRITDEFPYVLGCYRGDPKNVNENMCQYRRRSEEFMNTIMKALDDLQELESEEKALAEKRKKMKKEVRLVINKGYMAP